MRIWGEEYAIFDLAAAKGCSLRSSEFSILDFGGSILDWLPRGDVRSACSGENAGLKAVGQRAFFSSQH
jgi:hypothetical protein